MEIILLQDHKKYGKKGSLVRVADGFAMNFLVPQGVARVATKEAQDGVAQQQAKKVQQEKVEHTQARTYADALEGKHITIHAQAEGTTLFGSVGSKELAQAIKEQYNIVVTQEMINLDTPVKEVGTYAITVRFNPTLKASLSVDVKAR